MDKKENKFIKIRNLVNGVHYYKFKIDDKEWVYDQTKELFKDKVGHINTVIRVGMDTNQRIVIYNDLKIIRKEINLMRKYSAERNNEYYLYQEHDIIVIFRLFHDINPTDTYNGYVLISRPIYDKNNKSEVVIKVELPSLISELVFASNITVPDFDSDSIRKNKYFL